MEFIRTIKERYATQRQDDIAKEAEEIIQVSDFADNLYISYNGTPLIQIEDNWTPKDILQKLSVIRHNYINSRSARPSRKVVVL